MKLGKKGLASGIIIVMSIMFFSAVLSVISLVMWNQFNTAIQDAPNETISPDIKDKVNSLGSRMLWGDKIFMTLFLVMLVSFLITATTLPVDRPIYLLIFFGLLMLVTVVAMGLSNTWAYLLQHPYFAAASEDLPLISNFMRYLPIIVFLTGISGALIFYARKKNNFGVQGPGDTFE